MRWTDHTIDDVILANQEIARTESPEEGFALIGVENPEDVLGTIEATFRPFLRRPLEASGIAVFVAIGMLIERANNN